MQKLNFPFLYIFIIFSVQYKIPAAHMLRADAVVVYTIQGKETHYAFCRSLRDRPVWIGIFSEVYRQQHNIGGRH